MTDLTELLERVKAATGPDGTLDAAICAAFRYIGALGDQHMWTRNWKGPIEAQGDRVVLIDASGKSGPWTKAPAVTASTDAAVALVDKLLGCPCIEVSYGGGPWHAEIQGRPSWRAEHRTRPLALLTALLMCMAEKDVGAAPLSGETK